jgi:hypothetical protein
MECWNIRILENPKIYGLRVAGCGLKSEFIPRITPNAQLGTRKAIRCPSAHNPVNAELCRRVYRSPFNP